MKTAVAEPRTPVTSPKNTPRETVQELPDKPKRPMGRKPKYRGADSKGSGAPEKSPLPMPKYKKYHNAIEFMDYWEKLTAEEATYCHVYVYRWWPVINMKLKDPKAATNIFIIDGKIPFPKERYGDWFLHNFGVGTYGLFLNDPATNVTQTIVETERDLINYPPRIDYDLLMLTDPKNGSFVEWAKINGKIKSEEEKAKELEMGSSSAVQTLAEALVRTTEDRDNNRGASVDMEARSQVESMKLISQASQQAMSIVKQASDQVSQSQNRNGDPIEVTKSIVEVARSLQTPPAPRDDSMRDFMLAMLKTSESREDRLAGEVSELRKMLIDQMSGKNKNGDDKEGGFLSRLQELKEIKSLLTDLGGKAKSDDDEDEDGERKGKSSVWDGILKNLPGLVGAAGTILYNAVLLMQRKDAQASGAPQTAPPPQAPPNTPGMPQQSPVAGPTGQNPANPGTPQIAPTGFEQFHPFLAQIQGPMTNHMGAAGVDGADFAEWIIQGYGRITFDQLREAGPEALQTVMQSYPPLWEIVGKMPVKLAAFLDEFFRHDEIMSKREEEDEGEDDNGDE